MFPEKIEQLFLKKQNVRVLVRLISGYSLDDKDCVGWLKSRIHYLQGLLEILEKKEPRRI